MKLDCNKITKYWKDISPGIIGENSKFTDNEFPPNSNSLFGMSSNGDYIDTLNGQENRKKLNIKLEEIEWKRASEIFESFDVFIGKIESNDILQGGLGNCYFLSSLAALSEKPYLIYQLFRTKKSNNQGLYELVFYIDGQWQIVFIDDFFPVYKKTKKLCFSNSNENELWVLLLEKAWAKINGGYSNTIGGNAGEALIAITGFSTESIYTTELELEDLFVKMLKYKEANNVLCASSYENRAYDNYIISGHAYTIMNVLEVNFEEEIVEKGNEYDEKRRQTRIKTVKKLRSEKNIVQDNPKIEQKKVSNKNTIVVNKQETKDSNNKGINTKIVKLRNPWGDAKWYGTLTKSNHKVIQNMQSCLSNGEFLMTFEEFIENFELVNICHIMYDSYIKSYLLSDENNFSSPLVFNLFAESTTKISISVILNSWRFNRKLANLKRLCYLVVASYNDKREIKTLNGDWNCLGDGIEFVNTYDEGYYLIWLYFDIISYSEVCLPMNCIFKITSDKIVYSKFNNYDETFLFIQKLCVDYCKFNFSSNIQSCELYYKSFLEVLKNAGILALVVFNKTDNIFLRFNFKIKLKENVSLLRPYDNDFQSTSVNVPPNVGISIIALNNSYDNCNINITTNYKTYENELDIDEYKFHDFLILEVPDEKDDYLKSFTYTYSSELKAISDIDFNLPEYEEYDLEELIEENPFIMQMINSTPYSDEEIEKIQEGSLFFTKGKFKNAMYYGLYDFNTKQLKYRGGLLFQNGEVFIGVWNNNKINGKCKQYDSGKNLKFEGCYVDGKRCGLGILYLNESNIYQGNFENDLPEGHGTYIWNNHLKWEGKFVKGKKDGIGIITNIKTNEKVEVVEFKDDAVIKKVNISIEFEDKINKILKMNLENNKILEDLIKSYLLENTKHTVSKDEERIHTNYNLNVDDSFEYHDSNTELVKEVKEVDDFMVILLYKHYKKTKETKKNKSIYGSVNRIFDENIKLTFLKLDIGLYFGEVVKKKVFNGVGVLYKKNNSFETYLAGNFIKGSFSGYGETYNINKQKVYEGNFLNGFYHGKGIYFFSNGDYYSGDFMNGFRHGEGIYYWSDNSCWKGKFINDHMEGEGVFYYSMSPITQVIVKKESKTIDKFKISNNFHKFTHSNKNYNKILNELNSLLPSISENNLIFKEIIISDREIYLGEVSIDGRFEGRGSFIILKKIDEKTGELVELKKNDVKYYVGYWVDNLKNGKGKYFNSKFDLVFYGDFKNDKIDGRGRYYYRETNSYYDGEFSKGQKHGKGIYSWNNSHNVSRWEGNFLNDKIDGKGVFFYNNFNISDIIEFEQGNIVSRTSKKVYQSKEWKLEILKSINQLKIEREEIVDRIRSLDPIKDDLCLEWVEILLKTGIYIGQINTLNNPHGRGAFYYNSENKYYLGYWENGFQHGLGFEYKKDNNQIIYEGNYTFGYKNGRGKYYLDNNIHYEGIFDSLGNGWGIYQFEDETILKGTFINHLLHGKCYYYDKNLKLLGKSNYNYGELENEPVEIEKDDL